MSSSSKPSIFTARDAFNKRPAEAPKVNNSLPNNRTSSPHRRQSTPDSIEKNRIQAAAEAAPLAITLPQNTFASTTTAGLGGVGTAEGAVSETATTLITQAPICPPLPPAENDWAGRTKARSASVSALGPCTPPPADLQTSGTGHPSSGKKRPAVSPADERAPTSEPSAKRPRREIRPRPKHFLEGFSLGATERFQPDLAPPSPLFFSHSPRPRPSLPPRFSSSEAGAKMLSKARLEDSHVRTVSLARGVVSTPNLPTVASHHTASRRGSSDRTVPTRSRSPESMHGSKDIGGMLSSIGVTELLEQDERPTLIVDLGDKSNYGPGALHLVFANSALRSYSRLEALVCGTGHNIKSPGLHTHLQFKSWLMSAAVNGESLNVCLPSFLYANMTWTCSTLRKRLRIISGVFLLPSGTVEPQIARATSSIPPSTASEAQPMLSAGGTALEPSDYFGSAVPPSAKASDGSSSTTMEAVPSIEQPLLSDAVSPKNIKDKPLYTASRDLSREMDLSGATDLLPSSSSTYVPDPAVVALETASPARSSNTTSSHIDIVASDAASFDWTRLPITDSMPPHIQFARSIDWGATSLGPIETWNADLRQMCNLIMASPHPAAMYWGDDLIAIYNEAYILLAGQKHPGLMGMSYRAAWQEIWDEVKDVFANAKSTGEATMKDDDCLFIKRNNFLEETYFSWSIIPMVGEDGSVMGLYNPAFEKTRRKIAERRMLTLREVGERTASARDVKSFWSQVLGAFEFNEHDSPFLLLYSVTDDGDSDGSSVHSSSVVGSRQCMLEGSLGVPEDHPAGPQQIELKAGPEGFGPVFREVMKTDRPVVLEVGSRDLPSHLLDGLEFRGFGDPVRAVVVCPIHPTTGESVLGFLVLGINPRRPYDDDYGLFIQLLSRQLATSLASVVLFEEEIRRGQKAAKLAALDRIELSEQLAARTQEAIESEKRFTRMAEFAPVGMFIADSEGKINFANDTWYDISRVPKNSVMEDKWMDSIKSEDRALVKQLWKDLVVRCISVSSEFRFSAQWEDRNGNRGDTWVLFSAYPEKHNDGRLKSIFGSITNISQQKWAEGIQTRKMEEAVELKRQQENFIDITSHEMRNPLSAILQCSDEITSSLTTFRESGKRTIPEELLTSCLDAAQIINLCSQHQKRIVDDILTLSKLDSQLLLVTPVDAQPLTVVQRALKMHEGELLAADIQMKFEVDQSYRDMELDWVRFDPSRVLQVLINLTTNAIKFTSSEKRRTITVTIAASKDRPSDRKDTPVQYFPTRRKKFDIADVEEWGDGERVYIHFAVRDTGRGLNAEEKKMLFQRFSQASPRTHVQYGGSGLGLFISRELTELQGGEIGVESESNRGSTFAFYVVATQSKAPVENDALLSVKRGSEHARNRSAPAASVKKATQHLAKTAGLATNGTASSSKAAAKMKVLIIEDNLVNQRVLQKQLENLGTEVHLANHGGEALDKLRQSTYWADGDVNGQQLDLGILLMDQEMPVMDGLTCTRKIRELEQEGKLTGHVPIIAVTANARAEQVQTALDAGMVSFKSHL